MSASPEKRPAVLVVEAEALSEALQVALGPERVEVLLARHPAQARILAGSKRPAVLVIPLPGGEAQQARSLRGVLPATAKIVGLVSEAEPLDVPEGLDRVVRQGETEAVKEAVEALIEEATGAAQRAGSLASFADALTLAGPPGAQAEERAAEEEGADVDPSRAAAIRDLALSFQMHRSLSGGQSAAPAAPAVSLSLSAVNREDPSQVDIAVGSVSEALADLPSPAEAVTRTERLQALTAERQAALAAAQEVVREREAQAAALAQIRAHSPAREPTQAIELSFVKRRRRGRVLKLIVALVLVAGGVLGGYLYWQHLQEQKRKSYRPPPPETFDEALLARAEEARKRGLWVDPFAGLIARIPDGVRATDVDFSDEQLHRSVPELDRWFERALARLPSVKAREQLLGRAEPLVRFDDLKRARDYLDRARAIRDGADVRALLATVSEKEGQPEKAARELRRALVLAPRRHDLRLRLGLLTLKAGKPEEGCAELRRAAAKLKEARAALKEHCAKGGGAP